ncbi:MAG: phosphate signaling complex protein PhoU [Candidatus Omnitrophica bacterium]|nr:phosphate signaling complex protein PhoU [Candidatus Omnitrophota bacterium]
MLREKIAELKHYLLMDASLVEDMLGRSIKGLLDRDPALLEEVINTNEPAADDYDREIERMCVELIAQFEPVAVDLRMVIMIIKMNKDLERMADHAVNICESGLFLINNPVNGLSEKLKIMGDSTMKMLKDSISAFVHEDIALATTVCAGDDIVDEAGDRILKDLTELMKGKKDVIPRCLHVMRIAHNLERIADLSTNIAEEVIYIVEGRDIKHHTQG